MLWLVIAAATLQDGMTPLMVAAARGRTATLQSLAAAGADMNIQDEVSTAPQPEVHSHTCNHMLAFGNECCSYTAGWSHCTHTCTPTGKV